MAVLVLSHKVRLHCNPLIAPPKAGGVGRSGLNRRIAVSRTWRFVYYRVPKAANSAVMLTLTAHDPGQADAGGWTAHQAKRDAYVAPTDLGLVAAFAAARRYTAFTFVRDPYTRVLSAYLDKIANAANPRSTRRASRIRSVIGGEPAREITFADFVTYLQRGGLFDNIHWMPQSTFVPRTVAFIGYFERLERDLATLVPQLFHGVAFRQSAVWFPHRTRASERTPQYYTEALRQAVAKLYRDDFIRFGYTT